MWTQYGASCYAAVAATGSDGESTKRAALRHPGWSVNSSQALSTGSRGPQDAAERPRLLQLLHRPERRHPGLHCHGPRPAHQWRPHHAGAQSCRPHESFFPPFFLFLILLSHFCYGGCLCAMVKYLLLTRALFAWERTMDMFQPSLKKHGCPPCTKGPVQ